MGVRAVVRGLVTSWRSFDTTRYGNVSVVIEVPHHARLKPPLHIVDVITLDMPAKAFIASGLDVAMKTRRLVKITLEVEDATAGRV